MASFDLTVHHGICRAALHGALDYDESNKAIAAAAECSRDLRCDRIVFDLRDADATNYYSYIVRHAEEAPALGLGHSLRLAILGRAESRAVIDFMAQVAIDHGWRARSFVDLDEAERWLRESA